MKRFLLGFGFAALLTFANEAAAQTRIQFDPGGQIGQYMERFAYARSSGEKFQIDGPCISACTLITSVPPERICVTRRAKLKFHAAWTFGENGPVTSLMGTQALLDAYPAPVLQWIAENGGLSRKMLTIQGRELRAMYPECRTRTASPTSPRVAARRAGAQASR